MAKRPILPVDYNPIGDRLKRATAPVAVEEETVGPVEEQGRGLQVISSVPKQQKQNFAETLREADPVPELPTGREPKESSFRFRCTQSERKKWHDIARELTGEHSRLSHIARAAFLLVENAYDELKKAAPEIQRVRYPAKTDNLAQALYEQRLAQVLYDAIKAAGRPKG